MSKVLITGGSGFLATHVARLGISRGQEIILQTRGDGLCNSLINNRFVSLLKCSIGSLVSSDLDSVSSIIHLASAGVSPKQATWKELEEINVNGMLHICQLAHQIEAKLVVAGSCLEYGKSCLKYDQIPVDAPLAPVSPYATSKAAGCSLALGYARSMNTALAYLRVFNAFGEGQNESNLWPSLMKAANSGKDYEMTKGEQIRDFIPVQDVADHFLDVAINVKMRNGSPYVQNVGSGNPTTVRQFVEYWWKRCNAEGSLKIGALPYRGNEVMKMIPSLEAAYV